MQRKQAKPYTTTYKRTVVPGGYISPLPGQKYNPRTIKPIVVRVPTPPNPKSQNSKTESKPEPACERCVDDLEEKIRTFFSNDGKCPRKKAESVLQAVKLVRECDDEMKEAEVRTRECSDEQEESEATTSRSSCRICKPTAEEENREAVIWISCNKSRSRESSENRSEKTTCKITTQEKEAMVSISCSRSRSRSRKNSGSPSPRKTCKTKTEEKEAVAGISCSISKSSKKSKSPSPKKCGKTAEEKEAVVITSCSRSKSREKSRSPSPGRICERTAEKEKKETVAIISCSKSRSKESSRSPSPAINCETTSEDEKKEDAASISCSRSRSKESRSPSPAINCETTSEDEKEETVAGISCSKSRSKESSRSPSPAINCETISEDEKEETVAGISCSRSRSKESSRSQSPTTNCETTSEEEKKKAETKSKESSRSPSPTRICETTAADEKEETVASVCRSNSKKSSRSPSPTRLCKKIVAETETVAGISCSRSRSKEKSTSSSPRRSCNKVVDPEEQEAVARISCSRSRSNEKSRSSSPRSACKTMVEEKEAVASICCSRSKEKSRSPSPRRGCKTMAEEQAVGSSISCSRSKEKSRSPSPRRSCKTRVEEQEAVGSRERSGNPCQKRTCKKIVEDEKKETVAYICRSWSRESSPTRIGETTTNATTTKSVEDTTENPCCTSGPDHAGLSSVTIDASGTDGVDLPGPSGIMRKKNSCDSSSRAKYRAADSFSGDAVQSLDLSNKPFDDCAACLDGSSTAGFPLKGHAGSVLYILEDLRKMNMLCDVEIKTETVTLKAHRLVLSACCNYFYEFFCAHHVDDCPDLQEVDFSHTSGEAVSILVDSMYTGRLWINELNATELLQESRNLGYYDGIQGCEQFLETVVNAGNCYAYLQFAWDHSLAELEETALRTIAGNFDHLGQGTDYLALSHEILLLLLARDDLTSTSELHVFYRMLDWLKHDKDNRLCHALELLKEIRLPLMPPSDMVDHVEKTGWLMEVPGCKDLVEDAIRYTCLPARQSVLQSRRTRPRSKNQETVVISIGGIPRRNDPSSTSNELCAYNPKSNRWEYVCDTPAPIHHHAVAVLGGFIYVAGGKSSSRGQQALKTVHRFDPRTKTWLNVADMSFSRETFRLCALLDRLYALGGRNEGGCDTSVERYDPVKDVWEKVKPYASPRRAMAAASLAGKIYVAGGTDASKNFERYNPKNDHWEALASLPDPRYYAQLAAVNERLYLLGGTSGTLNGKVVGVTNIQSYDPNTNTWTKLGMALEARAEGGCAVFGGRIYLVGGYNWNSRTRLRSAEVLDLDLGVVRKIAGIPLPLTGITCCTATMCEVPQSKTARIEFASDVRSGCSESESSVSRSSQCTSSEDSLEKAIVPEKTGRRWLPKMKLFK